MAPEHVRLERLNAGAPFLRVHEAHDLDAVIGSVVPGSARIENGVRPFTLFLQAITIVAESQHFATSNVVLLGIAESIAPGRGGRGASLPAWTPCSVRRWRSAPTRFASGTRGTTWISEVEQT